MQTVENPALLSPLDRADQPLTAKGDDLTANLERVVAVAQFLQVNITLMQVKLIGAVIRQGILFFTPQAHILELDHQIDIAIERGHHLSPHPHGGEGIVVVCERIAELVARPNLATPDDLFFSVTSAGCNYAQKKCGIDCKTHGVPPT